MPSAIYSEGIKIIRVDTTSQKQARYELFGCIGWHNESNIAKIYDGKGVALGDTIICENGANYTCVARAEYDGNVDRNDGVIYAIKRGEDGSVCGRMFWRNIDGGDRNGYSITYIIPKDIDATNDVNKEPTAQNDDVNKEPMYTLEEIFAAVNRVFDYVGEEKIEELKQKLMQKYDPEYAELIRLKKKFGEL